MGDEGKPAADGYLTSDQAGALPPKKSNKKADDLLMANEGTIFRFI